MQPQNALLRASIVDGLARKNWRDPSVFWEGLRIVSISCVWGRTETSLDLMCSLRLSLVRGYWTQWTNWTECSRTCRHGNQTRSRTCVNPLPESGLELLCDDVADTDRRSCLISNCSKYWGIDLYQFYRYWHTDRKLPNQVSVGNRIPLCLRPGHSPSVVLLGKTFHSHSTSLHYTHIWVLTTFRDGTRGL